MSRGTPQAVWDLLAARRLREARRILADPDHMFNPQLTQVVDNSLDCAVPDGYVASWLDGPA